MAKKQSTIGAWINALIFVVFAILLVRLMAKDIDKSLKIILAIVGFGTTVIIHELGHFIVAKLSGIKCHTFSIGFPPTFLGFKRTEKGLRIRILPKFFPKYVDVKDKPITDTDTEEAEDTEDDETKEKPENIGRLTFTIGKKCKPSDTEYQLGIIPFGGFVGMLGQEDAKAVEQTRDPKSFTNKPAGIRMAVIAAGVIFNLIGAFVIFNVVAHVGIAQPPAVIGDVLPGGTADAAGIVAGDEVIEINGKTDLNFFDLLVTSALSDNDEQIGLKIKHTNGLIEDFYVSTKKDPILKLRGLGLFPADTLVVAKPKKSQDQQLLLETTGFMPADEIYAVNGREVMTEWQMDEEVEKTITPSVTLSAKRTLTDPEDNTQQIGFIDTTIDVLSYCTNDHASSDINELSHIFSMVPRMRVVKFKPTSSQGKLSMLADAILRKVGLREEQTEPTEPALLPGDIITKVGDIPNPTYPDVFGLIAKHNEKELSMSVLRKNADNSYDEVNVTVTPHTAKGFDRPQIGALFSLDLEHATVTDTIDTEAGPARLNIPSGAKITRVDGTKVESFYDIMHIIRRNKGQHITLDYRLTDEIAGAIMLNIPADNDYIKIKPLLTETIPFEMLRKLYKADGFFDGVSMGFGWMVDFVSQSYMTLKGLFTRTVGTSTLVGPIGIANISYQIIDDGEIIRYVYLLGMINCVLAVMNFLPIPIVDGGAFVLLIIEKLTGKTLSERVQEIIVYVGLSLLILLFLYITWNDIINLLTRLLLPQ